MAKTRAKLIDQINHLLAATGWTTVAEAETALLTAQRMIARHQITPSELASRQDGSAVIWVTLSGGLVVTKWRTHLAAVIAQNFRCSMLEGQEPGLSRYTRQPITKRCLFFLGHQEDVTVAALSYGYALRVAEAHLLAHLYAFAHTTVRRTQAELDQARADWCDGFVLGIRARFKAQTTRKGSTTAIMTILPDDVVAEAATYTHRTHTLSARVEPDRLTAHFLQGYQQGQRTGEGHQELAEGGETM